MRLQQGQLPPPWFYNPLCTHHETGKAAQHALKHKLGCTTILLVVDAVAAAAVKWHRACEQESI
jgi:hypothetical protein